MLSRACPYFCFMSKTKTVFYCQSCGQDSPKWLGKCPSCGQWNTFVEEQVSKKSPSARYDSPVIPVLLSNIEGIKDPRIPTEDDELNRVLGGGIVPGSVVLIGGEPGIGKSTLALQMCMALGGLSCLYITGEESLSQVKMRADRLKGTAERVYILTQTDTTKIFAVLRELKPDLVVVDSIQTMVSEAMGSSAGSVSQIREAAGEFIRFAKESATPVFIIGHVTKDGQLAGPKLLEHMVDVVLQFEGDRHLSYRMLRTLKNRFGSTSELGMYEMQRDGLRQVSNPSEVLITQRESPFASGVTIGATLEGSRPLLIEVQALVSPTAFSAPQRVATGFDGRRLSMLLAVLDKKCGLRLGNCDVFLNMAGGIRIEDPAADLAACVAIASSLQDSELSLQDCFAAEVGLGGELRAVGRLENRIAEAEKLGFRRIFVSRYNLKEFSKDNFKIKIQTAATLAEALQLVLG